MTSRCKTHEAVARGFTLVELVIVVAMLGILAAIAVPNFLEAQTRARVGRAYKDLRALALAAEAYAVDHNSYPPTRSAFLPLTRPVAYIHDVFMEDPFDSPYAYFLLNTSEGDEFTGLLIWDAFPTDLAARTRIHSQRYLFTSAGPDKIYLIELIDGIPGDSVIDDDYAPWFQALIRDEGAIYDPTNGTISAGDIGRSNKGITSPTLAN